VYGRQDAVEIARDKLGPYRLHILQAGGRVIPQLSRDGQERGAIYNQLRGGPLLL
jgi:hypothetical protein